MENDTSYSFFSYPIPVVLVDALRYPHPCLIGAGGLGIFTTCETAVAQHGYTFHNRQLLCTEAYL